MIIPVRCFSCGRPIAQLWEDYKKHIDAGDEPAKALEELNVERYCCRATFLGHAEMLPQITKFKKF
jgi:DNA-directed RNA polymerase subunit N